MARYAQGAFLLLTALATFAVARRVTNTTQCVPGRAAGLFSTDRWLLHRHAASNAHGDRARLVALLCLLRLFRTTVLGRTFVCGVSVRFAALAFPNIQVVLLIPLAWFVWRAAKAGAWRENAVLAVLLIAGVAACIGPVAVRNRVVSGEWVPISSNAGLNLYIGNNPHSDATLGIRPAQTGAPWLRFPTTKERGQTLRRTRTSSGDGRLL